MHDIHVLDRFDAPCRRPQALGFDAGKLWIASRGDQHRYSLDLATGLAHDGERVWTTIRERHQLLAFGLPG